MGYAHQEFVVRRRGMRGVSLRFWWAIGMVLLVGAGILPEAWALTVSPTAMTFQSVQGAVNPPRQTVSVSARNLRQMKWTATDNASWLSVSPGGGTISRTAHVVVAVSTAGLAAGTYSAVITIKMEKGDSLSVPVLLRVDGARPAGSSAPTRGSDRSQMESHSWSQGSGSKLAEDEPRMASGIPAGPSTPFPTTGVSPMASRTWNPFSSTAATGGKATVTPTTTSSSSTPSTSVSVIHTSTTASLSWSPVTSLNIAGYKVYMGTASGQYGTPLDVGNVTAYAVSNLAMGNTYYFVVTSYSTSGTESLPSAEVSKSIY